MLVKILMVKSFYGWPAVSNLSVFPHQQIALHGMWIALGVSYDIACIISKVSSGFMD